MPTDVLLYFGLDEAAKERLRALAPGLLGMLPKALDTFYERIATVPHLSTLIASTDGTTRLKTAQANHWSSLFDANFSSAYLERTVRIGAAHERIGLEPEWYLGGYLFMMEQLLDHVLDRHRAGKAGADIKAVLRATLFDASLSLSAYVKLGAVQAVKNEILTLSDMLEREATNTVGEIAHKAASFAQIARDVAHRSQSLEEMVGEIATAAESLSVEIETVAAAAAQMRAVGEEIGSRIDASSSLSQNAAARTQEAMGSVTTLSEAADRISNVVVLIRRIAAQTRMLALNATIEAARAGEVGRGFAVVAQEVKSLANQTEASIATVSSQADDIRQGTSATTTTMTVVTEAIADVESAARDISHAAAEQRTAAAGISHNTDAAAGNARRVAEHMRVIARQAEENQASALELESLSSRLNTDMDMLRERILRIVSTSTVKDDHIRVPVAIDARVDLGQGFVPAVVVDLSLAGALVRPRQGKTPDSLPMGSSVALDIDGIGTLPTRALMPAAGALHVQFLQTPEAVSHRIRDMVQATSARDKEMGALCQDAAGRITQAFTAAIRSGRISKAALFDQRYQEIAGSNPKQFTTAFTTLADALLPPIQEEVLTRAQGVILCAAVDRNGYLPTHNRIYSKPQGSDPVWNAANCRNRRIFNDRAGMLAAHNRLPIFHHTYDRDMGGGQVVFLKEVDCPIMIDGDHWGGLRLAYKA
ncbi:methyl-accepting chemotaxis protein [Azospirillum fermentarium]|uniref:protoglobin domain-containing protein n=1 Tax=Azospirillum fermentarium TaxID=1233114 RepID=UPI002227D5BE|nr:protoglobin domain-containing protein [Azospirillum fermentarium]MCW2249412.1 methyl-accepting chemotaxis protein [Azospirillum fermentarium]